MTNKPSKQVSDADRSVSTVIDAFSGGLANPQELIKSVGEVVQQTIQGEFMVGLFNAWNHLAKLGRVQPDYLTTPHGLANMREVLKAIELDDTDEARFEAVRNIFMNDAINDDPKNDVVVTRMLKIAANLSGGEILIMKVMHNDYKLNSSGNDIDGWEKNLAKATGLLHQDLVREDIEKLQRKNLLTSDIEQTSGYAPMFKRTATLTGLGHGLCKYMEDPLDKG